MKSNRSVGRNGTGPEMTVRRYLWNNGWRGYRVNWPGAPGRPDIAFPGRKIAVMVHGCFWHRCPKCRPKTPVSNQEFWQRKFERNVERDAENLAELEKSGWRVTVVWECEIPDALPDVLKFLKEDSP